MSQPKRSDDLQQVTWDQAYMLRLATLYGFQDMLNLTAAQLRKLAVKGHIHPVAKAPGGAFLYHAPTVIAAVKWVEQRRHAKAC